MEFAEALARMGFVLRQDKAGRGVRTYSAQPNRYLTYSVHAYDDGTALFTWEYAIADYLWERGIQIGSGERLNVFMYPVEDRRGPQDSAWLVAAVDGADAMLRTLSFVEPEG